MPRGRPPSKNKYPQVYNTPFYFHHIHPPASLNPSVPPNSQYNNANGLNNITSYDTPSFTPDTRFYFHQQLIPANNNTTNTEYHHTMSSNGKAKSKKQSDSKKKKETKPVSLKPPQELTPPSSPASTPSSPRNDSLKIKIKLGPAPSPPLLRILPLEAFLEFRGYLQPFLHHPANADWTETELRSLRTHIEAARASITEICEGAGKQADSLDTWRAAAGSPKRKADDKLKGKKVKRAHEEYKVTKDYNDDSAYSDLGSEDDDVDVDGEADVDVVTFDSADEPVKSEGSGRGGYGKRGGNSSKMANMIRRRGTQRQRLMKQKAARRRGTSPSSPSSPTFDENEAGSYENEFGEDDGDDAAAAAAHLGPSALWTALEAYFRPITENDLQFITPKPENPNDPIFSIPTLGSHYLQVWSNEDGEEKKLIGGVNATRATRMSATRGFGSEDEDDDPVIGDLTRRLLATLLEENLVVQRSSSPTPPSSSIDDDEELLGNPAISTLNYSRQAMFSLEDRIRMELRSIGLLDDEEIDITEREDDEVCTELRSLHQVLRDQMAANNEKKMRLLSIARPKMHEQEADKKQKIQNAQIEKNFQKMMQRKKKRGGRRPTTLPLSFPDEVY